MFILSCTPIEPHTKFFPIFSSHLPTLFSPNMLQEPNNLFDVAWFVDRYFDQMYTVQHVGLHSISLYQTLLRSSPPDKQSVMEDKIGVFRLDV